MANLEMAVKWMEDVAHDDSHGYDQANRNGPDYDCSSFIGTALNKAGYKVNKASTTRNLEKQLLNNGFEKISVGAARQRGDIFLKVGDHVVMCVDGSNIVHASINEKGTVTGGKTGDQTGKEICVRTYYNGNWDFHFRLKGYKPVDTTAKDILVNCYCRAQVKSNYWYPEVKNLSDYAGDGKNPITGIMIRTDKGSVKYRVHIKGDQWLPWVTGYSTTDHNNGYAGNGRAIDLVQVYYYTPGDIRPYQAAFYNVDSLPYQEDLNTSKGQDGYAGIKGRAITKFRIHIKK